MTPRAALAGAGLGVATLLVLGHPWVPLMACAVPAFLYYCRQSSRAEVIGANLWAVGAVLLLVVTPVREHGCTFGPVSAQSR